jgi:hypothetical protein
MRCGSWCPLGLDQAIELGGRRSVVPSCTRSSWGVVVRPVSNLVSIGGCRSRPSRTPLGAPVLRDQDRIGRPGTARPITALLCRFGRSLAMEAQPLDGRRGRRRRFLAATVPTGLLGEVVRR